ncbi:MAG: S8 family serine peptidase [Gemmatimonadales bacterium]
MSESAIDRRLSLRLLLIAAVAAGPLWIGCTGDAEPIAGPAAARVDEPPPPPPPPPGGEPDAYIVVLKSGVADVGFASNKLVADFGGPSTIRFRYRHAIKGFTAVLPAQAVVVLQRSPLVAYVERDVELTSFAPLRSVQVNPPSWGLDRIDQRDLPLDLRFFADTTGSGVNVYILDSGIRLTHLDFAGRARFVPNGQNGDFVGDDWGARHGAADCDGHGTHVAGIVGGASHGVAKGVTLWAARVLDCLGGSTASVLIAAVDWVTANAARPAVVNLSLGGPQLRALDEAVERSIASGLTYVVAAGNAFPGEHPDNACDHSPARVGPALTVGATESDDDEARFSFYGRCVDLLAPGVGIVSAGHGADGATATRSGTSMAAPHVAGAAALYLARSPAASPAEVAGVINRAATSGRVHLHQWSAANGTPNLLVFAGGAAPPSPTAPVVTIVRPANGSTFPPGSAITLEGTAVDAEDGDLSASLAWASSLDGPLGTGRIVARVLGAGTHTITAQVRDAQGTLGSAAVTVTVQGVSGNTPPTVTIVNPAHGAVFPSGARIRFEGTATDTEDGDIAAGLVWRSDRDGEIGRGRTFIVTLSDGPHSISAEVRDTRNALGSRGIGLMVQANRAPRVAITSPPNGAVFPVGSAIRFDGRAPDEDGDLSSQLIWISDRDGEIGRGSTFTRVLSQGAHNVTAFATDSRGVEGFASVFFTVAPNQSPTVIITSPANGASFRFDAVITFEGSAADAEDGDLTGDIVWTSNLEGEIGRGGRFETSLVDGSHTITATVTDSHGARQTGSIRITVRPEREPPGGP